jgi:peroxin-6
MGSPTLLHNISSPTHPIAGDRIAIQASPFGSRQPAIPTAKCVTVARVASPISVDRTYQPIFLLSLKKYFGTTKRLVKQGDLIPVNIDTDAVSRLGHSDLQLDELAHHESLDFSDEQ